MGNNKIRLLRADEIECRIAAINEQGISILLYKVLFSRLKEPPIFRLF